MGITQEFKLLLSQTSALSDIQNDEAYSGLHGRGNDRDGASYQSQRRRRWSHSSRSFVTMMSLILTPPWTTCWKLAREGLLAPGRPAVVQRNLKLSKLPAEYPGVCYAKSGLLLKRVPQKRFFIVIIP